jgi:hypothetical protein
MSNFFYFFLKKKKKNYSNPSFFFFFLMYKWLVICVVDLTVHWWFGLAILQSHHQPRKGPFEVNDIFAIINAIPAIALLAYGFSNKGMIPGLCFGAVSFSLSTRGGFGGRGELGMALAYTQKKKKKKGKKKKKKNYLKAFGPAQK